MSNLDRNILDLIINKTGKSEQTIRNNLSKLRQRYPKCTMNAVAHIYSMENGFSILPKLKKEDKISIPNLETETQCKIKVKKTSIKKKKPDFFIYDSKEYFIKGHVKELNNAYNNNCFTSAYILIRKIIENLLIDILRKKFPESMNSKNKELYYNITQKRNHDFSIIIDNLYKKRNEFGTEGDAIIQRINGLVKNLKKKTNDRVHSWFYLVENKTEFEEINVHQIVELIIKLEKIVGIK